ncbi:hypothetical protein OROHE_022496 [Orobanche hederae]
MSQDWKKLWRLKIPPKVKNFLWRAAHNCLPTKEKLLQKGISAGGNCGLCDDSYETSWHIFVDCPFVKSCWDAAELIEIMRGGYEYTVVPYMENRNDKIWNSKNPSPLGIARMACDMMNEWVIFQNGVKRCGQWRKATATCRGWHDLPSSWFYCSIDAAFFASASRTGIGIVIRDAHGSFVAAKTILFPGCERIEEGEAIGLYEALSWIKHRGMARVTFVMDSKIVHDALSSQSKYISELGAIIESCRALVREGNQFIVKWVRREANMVAHTFARMSLDFPYIHVWDEPPNSVVDLLHLPCSCP